MNAKSFSLLTIPPLWTFLASLCFSINFKYLPALKIWWWCNHKFVRFNNLIDFTVYFLSLLLIFIIVWVINNGIWNFTLIFVVKFRNAQGTWMQLTDERKINLILFLNIFARIILSFIESNVKFFILWDTTKR